MMSPNVHKEIETALMMASEKKLAEARAIENLILFERHEISTTRARVEGYAASQSQRYHYPDHFLFLSWGGKEKSVTVI